MFSRWHSTCTWWNTAENQLPGGCDHRILSSAGGRRFSNGRQTQSFGRKKQQLGKHVTKRSSFGHVNEQLENQTVLLLLVTCSFTSGCSSDLLSRPPPKSPGSVETALGHFGSYTWISCQRSARRPDVESFGWDCLIQKSILRCLIWVVSLRQKKTKHVFLIPLTLVTWKVLSNSGTVNIVQLAEQWWKNQRWWGGYRGWLPGCWTRFDFGLHSEGVPGPVIATILEMHRSTRQPWQYVNLDMFW